MNKFDKRWFVHDEDEDDEDTVEAIPFSIPNVEDLDGGNAE